MDGIRSRVNGWFYQNIQAKQHEHNTINNTEIPRWANYSLWTTGELILIHGRNWEITNCDLFTDNTLINSFNYDINGRRHSASWGYINNNILNNGVNGGCKPMDVMCMI